MGLSWTVDALTQVGGQSVTSFLGEKKRRRQRTETSIPNQPIQSPIDNPSIRIRQSAIENGL